MGKKKVIEEVQVEEVQIVQPVPEVKEETIHDKYREILNNFDSGIIRLKFPEVREIQVWVQQKTNKVFGVDVNCTACIVNLLRKFKSLE